MLNLKYYGKVFFLWMICIDVYFILMIDELGCKWVFVVVLFKIYKYKNIYVIIYCFYKNIFVYICYF